MGNEPDKVWVTISHTVNLGNFESYKVEAGYSKTIIDEEPLDMINEMHHELRAVVIEKAQRVKNGIDSIDELKVNKKRKF
jgi:hypothetical protein